MVSAAAGNGDYKVTPDEVFSAAAAANSTAENVAEQLAGIKGYVLSFEGAWQGIAANTFQALMHDYDVYGTMLNQSLTDIARGLHGNYVNYTETEAENLRGLQAVNGSIPGANFS